MAQARASPIVLTTYGYSRRGISLGGMTAIVMATPRRNGMRQILGRITRRGSDQTIVRQVVDIKDMETPLRSQSSDRRRVYKEKRYPIFRTRVRYTQYLEEPAAARTDSQEVPVWTPPAAPFKVGSEVSGRAAVLPRKKRGRNC